MQNKTLHLNQKDYNRDNTANVKLGQVFLYEKFNEF